ncbi:Ser/Thr protein phosphatase [Tritrichomonas foetus]|uniref:Serine/threonine-protein phosphatase n=1 Tax=Tritrichomonas foetus TaxID=1144522 RepID=A0A1J4KI73_9EUKA|nr:Ser/Thr protein phosphatase [Tritrichomonas foetus]|eukprot:OHT09366.1 Ser/Thr protein phosphatase [Tritrichomonas foetus]
MKNKQNAAHVVLRAFDPILHLTEEESQFIGTKIKIPLIDATTVIQLCEQTIEVFRSMHPTHIMSLNLPMYVVGDLHGNLHDFIRIWSRINNQYDQQYLFLGDYVDRGNFSIEICLILFALKIQYPEQIFMIRGNHEFTSVNSKYGFLDEVKKVYGDETVYKKINQVFNYIPLSAVISDTFFCVHGGLSPYLNSLKDIRKIPMPLDSITEGLVGDLVWSDPTEAVSEYVSNPRGVGIAFGERMIKQFFKNTNLKMIVRAHEKIKKGIRQEKRIITIFSTSGYSKKNSGGFCYFNPEGHIDCFTFDCRETPSRLSSSFFTFSYESHIPGGSDNNVSQSHTVSAFLTRSATAQITTGPRRNNRLNTPRSYSRRGPSLNTPTPL